MARIGITSMPENGIEISKWTGTELCVARLYRNAEVTADGDDKQTITADVVDLPMIEQGDIQDKLINHFDDYFKVGKQNDIMQKIIDGDSSAAAYESYRALADELAIEYAAIEAS